VRWLALPTLVTVLVLPASAGASAPSLVASRTIGPAPLAVQFRADVSATDPEAAVVSYAWSFGDGTVASGQSVPHRFVEPGRYTVTLTTTDETGTSTSSSIDIVAQGIRMSIAPAKIVFGKRVAVRGRLVPAAAGARVVLERRVGSAWQLAKTVRTDAAGRFRTGLRPARNGTWRARAGMLRSLPAVLNVAPQLEVSAGAGSAFRGAPLLVRARPQTAAPVQVTVLRGGREVGQARGTAGQRFVVPTPGIGRFAARVELAGRAVTVPLRAAGPRLAPGSSGPDVLALRARLAQLRVHVPGPSTTFGAELGDAVIAFQKARGLARTGVVDDATWRALGQDAVPAPRYRSRDTHIEVSKSRQILLIVRNGETIAYLPVSSGAGGITPTGDYRIRWKAPATTTWLGSAILYRTMTFRANTHAIHGFPSVPTYPASHGCVRVPIWLADWLYQQSPVGERVYIYE
jgi:PKD repeat protein